MALYIKKLIYLSILLSLSVNAAKEAIFDVAIYKKFMEEVYITNEFRRGEFLIYNCDLKHFACVNKDSFKLCANKRRNSKEFKQKGQSCRPIRSFKDQASCFTAQYKVSQKTSMENFCKN